LAEYELDLLMRNAFGYGLPAPLGPTLGSVYFNVLVDRLTNATGNATDLYLEFGHDTTIDLFLTGAGLVKCVRRGVLFAIVPTRRLTALL
jgi:acid phosphatase